MSDSTMQPPPPQPKSTQPEVMQAEPSQFLSAPQGGTCPSCHALVADDQSYCLSCGARQPKARMPVEQPGSAPQKAARRSDGGELPPRDWTPVLALGGLAVLALVLVIGVLIGKSGQSNSSKLAASPQVITVAGGGGTGTTAAVADSGKSASISEDWPSGKSAWTVQLQTVKKAGASAQSVDSAKSAATGKGATGVGVLDAANYKALGSDYIIYSGVYDSQAKANAALGKLKKAYPSAKVIHVEPIGGGTNAAANSGPPPSAAQQAAGAAAIQQLNNCTGAACSKAARKITQPIATPGAAPPADNKPAGGGSGAQTFQ
jgi:hypothetical protein